MVDISLLPWLKIFQSPLPKPICLSEQGWRSGESTRLPLVWPGFNSGVDAICGLSLLLVLFVAPRGFSPGTPAFPLLKTNTSKFQFDLERTETFKRVQMTF